jgi:lysophospholipase L1-like esterase
MIPDVAPRAAVRSSAKRVPMILRPERFRIASRAAARASAAACVLCVWAGLIHCGAASDTLPGADATSTSSSGGASSQGSSAGGQSSAHSSSSGATTAGSSTASTAGSSSALATDAGGAPDATRVDSGGGDASARSDASTTSYQPCPTDGGACAILPLGDSITFGLCNGGSTGCPGGYRVQLFNDAVTDHKKITFVGDPTLANGPATVAGVAFPPNNVGHSGWTITQIDGLLPGALKWSMQPNPNIVLLHIGTNDFDGIGTMPPASAPMRLGTLIDDVFAGAPNVLLVVAQIVPYPANDTAITTYNAAIPALVQQRAAQGKHIVMVDMHTGFQVSTMISTDNIHPNLKGYVFMGDTWYAAIKSVLP